MFLGFVARICSSSGNPSICFFKLSNTGSESCSISMRGTLFNGSILYISMLIKWLIVWQCDTVMVGNSVSTALRFSCLWCHSCSSDGNLASSVWKKTLSSCALPVDSMLSSIGCAGTPSLILKIIFSFGSDSKRDRCQQRRSFCLECVIKSNWIVGKFNFIL